MLQRTLSSPDKRGKNAEPAKRWPWRPAVIVVVVGLAVSGLYLAGPAPAPRQAPAPLEGEALRSLVAPLRAPPPALGRGEHERASLGRRLFGASSLGGNGKACASCHDPRQRFGSAGAPSLANAGMSEWLYADGRSDSLAAAALAAIEDARQLGGTRSRAVAFVRDHDLAAYEAAFGPFPPSLRSALPAAALPPPPALTLPIGVAAEALASLGSYPLLEDILNAAQAARRAPATELTRRAFALAWRSGQGGAAAGRPKATDAAAPAAPAGQRPAGASGSPSLSPYPRPWTDAWAALPPATQQDIDRVYANIGRALAAYIEGLTAVASPFDRFAARLAAGAKPRDAMDTAFGDRELAGLQVFGTGPDACANCHGGPSFSDQEFHNIGLTQHGPDLELGRAVGVARLLADPFNGLGTLLPCGAAPRESCRELPYLRQDAPELIGAYKTPTLRNVALRASYMHDGRFTTLAAAIRAHDGANEERPAAGHAEKTIGPLQLSEADEQALEAFLRALSSPIRDLNAPAAAQGAPGREATRGGSLNR